MASTLERAQRLLTVAETAERLRVSRWTIYRLVESGKLPAIKLGSGRMSPIRVSETELAEWLLGEDES
jgi:excisionase family DNA binding protein